MIPRCRPGRVPETIRRSIFRTIFGTQTISWPFWSPTICRTILATIFARRFFKHSCCVLSRKSVFGKLARKLAHKLARKLAHKLAHKLASKLASDIVRRPSGVRSQRYVLFRFYVSAPASPQRRSSREKERREEEKKRNIKKSEKKRERPREKKRRREEASPRPRTRTL